ncbi:MAG: response regulator transcription factor [Chitinivibrionales bacterium]|nr:response regulator transcription factor [Chitinivibrionales bacterium]
MKILIAEDDILYNALLTRLLTHWQYPIELVTNGKEALAVLSQEKAPQLAILDWMMPEMDGLEVCRSVRQLSKDIPTYIILLTARIQRQDILAGFEAGVDDYITKPFDKDELRARIKVGQRVIQLQTALHKQIIDLKEAFTHIKTLQGILPVCASCHRIRNDQESWERIEKYITEHSDAQLSHTVCPECMRKLYPEYCKKDNDSTLPSPDNQ